MHDRLEEYIDSNGGLTYQWWVEAVRPVQVEESLWDDVDCGSSSFQGWGNLPDLQGLGMPQGIPCTGYLWNLEEPSLGTIGSALTGRFETACQRCEASQVLQLGTPNQLFGWPSWTGGKSVALGLPTLMLCPPNLTGFTKQCERSRWASRELRNREKSKTEISCPNLEEKVPAESHRSMSQNWGIYILWVTRKIPGIFFRGECGLSRILMSLLWTNPFGRILVDCGDFGIHAGNQCHSQDWRQFAIYTPLDCYLINGFWPRRWIWTWEVVLLRPLQCKKKLTWRTSKTRGNPQTWLILLRKNHEVPGFGLNQLDAPMVGSNFLAALSTCWASQWLWTYTYNSFGNARRQRLMWRSLVATSVALNLRRTSKWPQQKGGIDHTEPSKGDVTVHDLNCYQYYPVIVVTQ